ncbi:MAG: metallophosphoesterase [Prevotella sp.]|jgi:predicted MPP superfamily phosphohydrolase
MKWIFIFVPLFGIGYVSWHLWQLLPWGNLYKSLAIGLPVAALFFVFSLGGLLDRLPLNLSTVIYEVVTSLPFIFLYLFLIFIVLDLGRLTGLVPRSWLHHNGTVSLVITGILFAVFLYGNLHYYHKHREEITLDSHGKVSRPLKVVMLSDLHLGFHNRRAELDRWVKLINKEQPDLILIAGDIIDIRVHPLLLEHDAEAFHNLSAPVYACLGNHEYYSGSVAAQRFYHEAGIHLLRDSVATVGDLCIVGRDDRTNFGRASLATLMKQSDRKKYVIVMDHQPYHLEEAQQNGADFQLSGHTHYGQVWPISWITDAIYECAFGAYTKGHTQYYVTSGMGIWGGKFRIGTRSEYVVAHLTVSNK